MNSNGEDPALEPESVKFPESLGDVLIGLAGFQGVESIGDTTQSLTEPQMLALLVAVRTARRKSGLSPRAFMALKGRALRSFCSQQKLPALQVRLAQMFVRSAWLMRHQARLNGLISGPVHFGPVQ